MTIRKITGALFFILPLIGLGQGGIFILKGKIESDTAYKRIVFIRYFEDGKRITDSVTVKENRYHFSKKIKDPVVSATLEFFDPEIRAANPNTYEGLLEVVSVYLEPTTITVLNRDAFSVTIITGSKTQDELELLDREMKAYKGNGDEVFLNFARHNPGSWNNFMVLNGLLMGSTNPRTVDSLYNRLSAQLKSSPEAKKLRANIDKNLPFSFGNPAIEFSQNDTSGKPISLHDLRGKYILVDFWASWCGPCRMENPNLVKAYEIYKAKGFDVLGVSLDDNKDEWLKAIDKDKLVWTQISDLKGQNNEVVGLYQLAGIPSNILIDPKGIIIGRNLHGESLTNKLKEVFNN